MTSLAAGETSVSVPEAQKATVKKARKNPQRRKTSQGQSTQQSQRPSNDGKVDATKTPPAIKRTTSAPTKGVSQSEPRASVRTVSTKPSGTVAKPSAQPRTNRASAAVLAPAALVTGGLLGCAASAAVLASVGIWHGYAGSESAILAARSAKLCLDNLASEIITSLEAGTYSTDEAIDMLRRTCFAYASTIPRGTQYVERIFRELDHVRKTRGAEVDRILKETQTELNRVAKTGANADEMRLALVSQLNKLSKTASSSVKDVVDRNPDLKPYRDGAIKSMQGSPPAKSPTMKVNLTIRQSKSPS